MKIGKILFKSTTDIVNFVHIVNRYPYRIDLVSGNYRVDGKSIMGIFSLPLSTAIQFEIYADDCTDLTQALQPCVVA